MGVGASSPSVRPGASPNWVYALIAFEFACQLLLLTEAVERIRAFARVAAFAGSLGLLFALRGPRRRAPAAIPAAVAIAILALEGMHPLTNSAVAAGASVIFNLAIVAPIFWATRVRIDAVALRRIFLLYWAFNFASAAIGALQVYFPGALQPAMTSVYAGHKTMLEGMRITLASGARVFRPMGLTDTPGGGGIGGLYCALLSLGFLLNRPRPLFRLVLLFSIGVALFTLYLCQVRSLVVMLAISALSVGGVLSLQRNFGRIVTMTTVLVGVALLSFVLAVAIGGDAVNQRLLTLVQDNPASVYQEHRGFFLEYTFSNLLPQFPLGAGLGRWGMINAYFGDPGNWQSAPIYAEIAWTAWVLDGGIPLTLAWLVALTVTTLFAVRVAVRRTEGQLRPISLWAAIMVGYDIGALALTFDSHPFAGTFGLDFWLLNGALFAAAMDEGSASSASRHVEPPVS